MPPIRHRLATASAAMWLAASAAAPAVPEVLGDLDEDGRHTVRDVVKIVNHLQAIEFLPGPVQAFADVNEDGRLDSDDVEFLIEVILENEELTTIPKAIPLETSPTNGEGDVSLTRETLVRFSLPLADTATLSTDQFRAEFAGRQILSRVEISGDRMKATLFYLENLPASARVRVTLEGEGLTDYLGRELDLDRDGQPGGDLVFDFDTVSITPVPNTGVVGTVFAAEKAADGSDVPLSGVIIEVVGAEEDTRTTTAADGTFSLSPVPAGEFFVNIDGRPVTGGFPGAAYYPFVGKVWETRAGLTTNPAGGTGVIYLPEICPGTLQVTSPVEETMIDFPAEVVGANPELAGTEIRVPAGALFSNDGTRGGSVGIAPVPPDRLPEPLPDDIEPGLVITIQTDGPTNFDQPVPVKFPNLPGPDGEAMEPGEEAVLWSFDHDVGKWEIAGSMTVSADGQFVESDPGTGVRQPGWHRPSPPRVQGTGGGAAPFPPTAGGPSGSGGPGEGGLPGPGGGGGPGTGPGAQGGGEGPGGGGPLLGGPGSDYGAGNEGCTFASVADYGMIIPGDVRHTGPATVTAGVSITFVSDGARDTGGVDRINCPDGSSRLVDIPPAEIDYRWVVFKEGLVVVEGFGLTATVPGNITGLMPGPGVVGGPGTYEARFIALPRRTAVRERVIDIGTAFVNVVPAENWTIDQVGGDGTSIAPGAIISLIEGLINLVPGLEIMFDRTATAATVERGRRSCIDPRGGGGGFIANGETYRKGTVQLSAMAEGPLFAAGYVEKIRVTILGARVRAEFKIGATVSTNITFSVNGGEREDQCRSENCFFGSTSLAAGIGASLGFEAEALVAIPGWGIYQVPSQSVNGISASLTASATLAFNGEDNCWRGMNGTLTLGELKFTIGGGAISVPLIGSFPLPSFDLVATKAYEQRFEGNPDPLGQ